MKTKVVHANFDKVVLHIGYKWINLIHSYMTK